MWTIGVPVRKGEKGVESGSVENPVNTAELERKTLRKTQAQADGN